MAQRFSARLWPRAGSWSPGIESHVGLPAWSLLLPLPVCRSDSPTHCVSGENKQNLYKKGKEVVLFCIVLFCFDRIDRSLKGNLPKLTMRKRKKTFLVPIEFKPYSLARTKIRE